MMGNLGLHVIRFPSGRFGFVGRVPACLGEPVAASKSDVVGGRAFRGDDGSLQTLRFPSFETPEGARGYAFARGVEITMSKGVEQ